jgi:hypothetical protein
MGAPDRHCSLSGALPRHPTVRVQSWVDRWSFVLLRHRTVWCHTGQSGAPLTSLLWLLRGNMLHCSSVRDDRWRELAVAPLVTGQSSDTPDSPVNYSGARLRFPQSGWMKPVRTWCTRHCPVAQQTVRCANSQHTQVLCSVSNWVPNLNLLLVCVEPYAPVIHEF